MFLTWMNLLVFVRRFSGLGIYVLMFTDTLATVVKVSGTARCSVLSVCLSVSAHVCVCVFVGVSLSPLHTHTHSHLFLGLHPVPPRPCAFVSLCAKLQVLCVFSFFIVAFGLAFYIMLGDQQSFRTPGTSMARTLVMMTGEYNFDIIFLGGDNCTLGTVQLMGWDGDVCVCVCVFFFVVALQVKSQKTAVLNCAAHRQSNKQTRQPKLLDDINKKLE